MPFNLTNVLTGYNVTAIDDKNPKLDIYYLQSMIMSILRDRLATTVADIRFIPDDSCGLNLTVMNCRLIAISFVQHVLAY